MIKHRGFTVWFTGLPGSGKATLSNLVHKRLKEHGITNVEMLDGETVNEYLSGGSGFTKEDRDVNIRRLGWVAHLLTKNNIPNLVSAISPYRDAREEARKLVEHVGGKGSFVEVFVDCPVEVCEERDDKGLYSKAKSGEIKQFTGVDEPYEKPHNPEIHIRTDALAPEDGVEAIMRHLKKHELISF